MKIILTLVLCLGSFVGCKDNPVTPDISGTWNYTYTTGLGGNSGTMVVSGTGSNTSASLTLFGTPVTLTGSVSDTEVNLSGSSYLLTAKLNGDKSRMDGTLQYLDSHFPFTAIKR